MTTATTSTPAQPTIEEVMAELRAGYRKLKGNALATDEEVADYLYAAFHLASCSQNERTADIHDGFYVKDEAAAQYTLRAINTLRGMLLENEMPRPFQMIAFSNDKTYRITTSNRFDRTQHETNCAIWRKATGAKIEDDRKKQGSLLKPAPHDRAQNQSHYGHFVFGSSFLQAAILVADAPTQEDGSIVLSDSQAKFLGALLPRTYQVAFKNGELTSLFKPIFASPNIPRDELQYSLSDTAVMRFLIDARRASEMSKRYGERYYLGAIELLAERNTIPINKVYNISRDFLDATFGTYLDGNTLYVHDQAPETIEPWLKRMAGENAPADCITYHEDTHSFTLSDDVAETYKKTLAHVHHLIIDTSVRDRKPMEVVKYLNKLGKVKEEKPVASGKQKARPEPAVKAVEPEGRMEGDKSQEPPAPATAAAVVIEDTKANELKEFMDGFAGIDAAAAEWERIIKAATYRTDGSYLLKDLSPERAEQTKAFLAALSGNIGKPDTAKTNPSDANYNLTISFETKAAVDKALKDLNDYKVEAQAQWQSGSREDAIAYKEAALEAFNKIIPDTVRLSLPRADGRAVGNLVI